jgi:hypothetical protein
VVTEEASRLKSSNAKLSQDVEGKSDDSSVLVYLSACFLSRLDLMTLVIGSRMIHVGMVVQLAMVKQERNAAILKVIEKDDVLKRLSKQLHKIHTELEQVRTSREQDAAALNQSREARHNLEAIAKKAIGDVTKLGRSLSLAMVALGVSLGPRTPEVLIEEVGRLPGVVRARVVDGSSRGTPDSHHDRVALPRVGPHDAERRPAPWHLRRPMRRTGGRLRRLHPRDGRRRVEGSGAAATR